MPENGKKIVFEEAKTDMFEDTQWNRERFRRMDAALTRIDESLDKIIDGLNGTQAVLDEFGAMKSKTARDKVAGLLAEDIREVVYGLDELQELVNQGLTVQGQEK